MKYTRRFHVKTIILTKKKMIKYGALFLAGVCLSVLTLMFHNKNIVLQNMAMRDDVYMHIIDNTLPNEKEFDIKSVVTSILGFDAENPQSILSDCSSMFTAFTDLSVAKEQDTQQNQSSGQESEQPQQTAAVPSAEPQNLHDIKEVNINKGMTISNATKYEVNTGELASNPLNFAIEKNDKPQVLIVHTHTTESYTDSGKTKYSSSESDRSTDETKNIVAVGNAINDVLNQKGIKTVHDTTVHDYPSYNGAYGRSLSTVKENLGKYPSIKVVLDVHRDGLVREDGTKLKVATDINGVKTAQVMLVVGSNASGLSHDKWQENMKFACKIQQKANELYPTLMRPINLREERFNQHMTLGSLIIEVGSNGNTLAEAIEGGKDIADVISAILNP